MPPEQHRIKPLIAPVRVMLILAGVLVFISGVQLFVFTEQTDRFFAWTIKPPLTAAFLGGAYWSSTLLEWLAARETQWARARVAVTAVLAFTLITLIVTLIHLDRFHLNNDDPLARTAAWAWLIVYAIVPPVLAILLAVQVRASGGNPPVVAPLPAWLWPIIGLQAAALLTVGAMLLVAPGFSAPLWPWQLTPLTARAIGAWLIGLGIAAAQVLREGDVMRVRGVQISSVVFVALQAIALARYPDTVSWSDPRLWGYILFLASILAVSLYAWRAAEAFRRL
jgi:multisubunit Na+/H+ antiporter MnhG subunit